MNLRVFLKISTAGLILAGISVSIHPFISAMGISEDAKNNDLAVIDLPELKPGELVRIEIEGKQLIVLKPDDRQKESIEHLDAHVWYPESQTYHSDVGAYVYWAKSTRWGCPLEHKPPEEPRSHEWYANMVWLGGYWDDRCEVSYDYAGRSIKSHRFTYNGYSGPLPNLYSPKVFNESNGKYIVSLHQEI